MNTAEELKSAILKMDHRGYPAYKSLAGSWRFPEYILNIDHVQGDPFASPSSLSVRIDGKRAGFPAAFLETQARRRALEDALVRRFQPPGTGGPGADRVPGEDAGRGDPGPLLCRVSGLWKEHRRRGAGQHSL